jgi:hypothetical protein
MSETYVIKKIMEPFTDDVWEQIPTLRVQNFPWDENGYKPETIAKICYRDKAIHVFLKSYEKKIRAVYESINDPVCRDSCMEFFFILNPESDDRYMNMEMNPIGTFLLGFGKDRHSRFKIEGLSPDIFNIKTSVKKDRINQYNGEYWTLQYEIPFSFLEKYYGKTEIRSGKIIKGNVYKCGDDTEYPHYGCWNRVTSEKPDFHRPECFGDFILE